MLKTPFIIMQQNTQSTASKMTTDLNQHLSDSFHNKQKMIPFRSLAFLTGRLVWNSIFLSTECIFSMLLRSEV